jgi:hypothetical protein
VPFIKGLICLTIGKLDVLYIYVIGYRMMYSGNEVIYVDVLGFAFHNEFQLIEKLLGRIERVRVRRESDELDVTGSQQLRKL